MGKILLDDVDVDTTGDAVIGQGACQTLVISADAFGGGTVSLETSANGTTHWTPIFYDGTPFEVLVPGAFYLRKMAQGLYVRAILAGSTGASNVTVLLTD